ncbi:hypothetical protein [Desulfopila aestuarii]|uniref:Patatin-like phospholipase n=1 Tax=Desulfopila aestuarii DSM 18488 TaxID=1121416 RepID=A0A1M7XWB0_9BACT|nr:hypothetical protein [Desulfopila aestuarii]SHO42822.1 hypothetical protein SAMN02745220_00172 [Desulfopila aestuarii DSM 18488]
MASDLLFLAGHRAYERIRADGLSPDEVQMVVGASGAAKWLVLHGLESAIFGQWFSGRTQPLHLYGTSIGSWKSVAAARRDPEDGFTTLARAYIHQYYQGKITSEQVARETGRILEEFLGPGVPEEVLAHPYCRLHLSSVRCRGLLASDHPQIELAGLLAAWLANRFSRSLFQKLCPPTLFYDPRTSPPFLGSEEFVGGEVQLTTTNFRQAVLASGSIPCVMKSVRTIHGAQPGSYRDGGLYHYHPAFDFLGGQKGIVLYPHFYSEVTLGWLDKGRKSRIADGCRLADVLLLAPSPQFVAELPFSRIPDRRDFVSLAGRDSERVAAWNRAVTMSRRLGEQFLESVEFGAIRELVQRIP